MHINNKNPIYGLKDLKRFVEDSISKIFGFATRNYYICTDRLYVRCEISFKYYIVFELVLELLFQTYEKAVTYPD